MKRFLLILLVLLAAVATYYFFPERTLPRGARIDKLIVYKSKNRMEAFSNGRLIRIYTVAIGQNPAGDKVKEGDKRTPEGSYIINAKNPNSGYYKNLGISYPNKEDRRAAHNLGVSPGGDVKIHGLKNGRGYISKFHRFTNWTNGCLAVTNEEMEELYNAVPVGTPIIIKP